MPDKCTQERESIKDTRQHNIYGKLIFNTRSAVCRSFQQFSGIKNSPNLFSEKNLPYHFADFMLSVPSYFKAPDIRLSPLSLSCYKHYQELR